VRQYQQKKGGEEEKRGKNRTIKLSATGGPPDRRDGRPAEKGQQPKEKTRKRRDDG